MKEFSPIQFDPAQARLELEKFAALLAAKQELAEREDLQPLFESCPHLASLIGMEIPGIGPADLIAYEFEIFGDFVADIVLGNSRTQSFCAIELEDGRSTSIFNKTGARSTREWSRHFERGFSQLVDWFFAFDDHKNSANFSKQFDYGHIQFAGMLLIGRSDDLSDHERTRLRWRSERVQINTHKILCRTFDELYESLDRHLHHITVSALPKTSA